jgi:hypothetical protein
MIGFSAARRGARPNQPARFRRAAEKQKTGVMGVFYRQRTPDGVEELGCGDLFEDEPLVMRDLELLEEPDVFIPE